MKKLIFAILALALILASVTAFAEATKVTIATEGAYAPYNYIDDDGNPDGYDIAVAKAVDELLEDYEFDYIAVEWSSIFAGLEADRYQVIVSQASKTAEREVKYSSEIVMNPKKTEAVDVMYTGTYAFGCTLPNYVIEDKKSPLRIEISMDGNELTYHIRK